MYNIRRKTVNLIMDVADGAQTVGSWKVRLTKVKLIMPLDIIRMAHILPLIQQQSNS